MCLTLVSALRSLSRRLISPAMQHKTWFKTHSKLVLLTVKHYFIRMLFTDPSRGRWVFFVLIYKSFKEELVSYKIYKLGTRKKKREKGLEVQLRQLISRVRHLQNGWPECYPINYLYNLGWYSHISILPPTSTPSIKTDTVLGNYFANLNIRQWLEK